MAQEALHSIKLKNLKGMMLKIDLPKDFDNVIWLYLWMLLIHLGFPSDFIKWIMCCITLVSFAIFINGSSSHTFQVERGLKQGFPLPPTFPLGNGRP